MCSDSAVNASLLPSAEIATPSSGPGPVVRRLAAVARKVCGLTVIFQMFLAPL